MFTIKKNKRKFAADVKKTRVLPKTLYIWLVLCPHIASLLSIQGDRVRGRAFARHNVERAGLQVPSPVREMPPTSPTDMDTSALSDDFGDMALEIDDVMAMEPEEEPGTPAPGEEIAPPRRGRRNAAPGRRGRRRHTPALSTNQQVATIQQLRERRRTRLQDKVHAMTLEELRALVLKMVDKRPAVVLDIIDVDMQREAAEEAAVGGAAGGGTDGGRGAAGGVAAGGGAAGGAPGGVAAGGAPGGGAAGGAPGGGAAGGAPGGGAAPGGVAAGGAPGGGAAGGAPGGGAAGGAPGGGAAGGGGHGLEWCTCHHCREMPTDQERICCGGGPDSCVSTLPDMDLYILDPGTLWFARNYRNDMLALQDAQEPGADNREFRHAAYRHYVLWQYGRLGEGNRVVIPSCCVWRIRDTYPDPHNHYTGYIANRL
ncbi:uncharacterized protein LOC144927847 [Branchiostoma floridae x Branchiostoma belcheri]